MKTVLMAAMCFAAGLSSPAVAKDLVPFRGSLQLTETAVGQPPILSVHSSGGGEATHLGRFTATFVFQVDVTTSTALGSFILIAANGDSVFGTFSGHATGTGRFASVVETATITGGTGRFADATGSFTIERALDHATGLSSGSFNGTIDLDD